MKILLISQQYYPLFGGIERFAHRLAIEFKKKEIDLKVITARNNPSEKKEEAIDGIETIRVGFFTFLWRIKGLRKFANYFFFLDLYFFLKKNKQHYDLIFVMTIQRPLAVSLLVKKFKDIPVIGLEGSFGETLDYKVLRNFGFSKFFQLIIKKNCDKVVCFGNAIKQQYLHLGFSESQLEIIPNGVSIIDNYFQYNYKSNNILCVGRFVPEKGQVFLVKAFSKIKQNYKLILHGQGIDYQKILQNIKFLNIRNDVLISKPTNHPISDIFQKASFCVIPSFIEGMSCVQIEAMSLGVPMIVTNVGCNAEVLQFNSVPDNKLFLVNDFGVLINPGDELALCTAIEYYIENPEIRIQMSKNLKKRYIEKYSMGKIAIQYKKLFSSLIKARISSKCVE